MKKIIIVLSLFLINGIAIGQVKIGANTTTLNPNSLFELESTTKGVLLPRLALTSTTAFAPMTAHVAGMTIYNTATTGDVTPGLYYNDGTSWIKIAAAPAAVSVVTVTAIAYNILGTEDIILGNPGGAAIYTLPISTTIGKRIVIANKSFSGGNISIAIAAGGTFWNGTGFATAVGNTNIFTYTASGWINEAIGLN
jgi:hypothetical protein